MYRYIGVICAAVLSTSAFSEDNYQRSAYCLSSKDGKVNFMLVHLSSTRDGWNGSYVKYNKSDKAISLIYNKSEYEEYPDNSKPMVESFYNEYVNGEFNGEYIISSQGAVIYDLVYRGENGKEVQFEISKNAELQGEPGVCVWPRK